MCMCTCACTGMHHQPFTSIHTLVQMALAHLCTHKYAHASLETLHMQVPPNTYSLPPCVTQETAQVHTPTRDTDPCALQDSLRCNSLSQFLKELVLFREAGAGDGGHPDAVQAGEARGWRTRAGALLFGSGNQGPLACLCCRVRT